MSNIYIAPIFTSQNLKDYFTGIPQVKTYKKGDVVAHVGQKFDYLHFLVKGKVKYVITTANGDELLQFITIGPALFGEVPFFSGLPIFGSFIAAEPSQIQLISSDNISRECLEVLCAQMARKLRVAHLQYESTFSSAETRMARYLYTLSVSMGTNMIEFSQRELANIVGVHYMTVHKILKKFEEVGIAVRRGRRIEIKDPEALLALAGLPMD